MSATAQFLLAAAILTLAALALVLRPLWRAPKAAGKVDRRKANLDIFRDQLQELEADRNEGLLSAEDFEQARNELQRRLLEDTNAANGAVSDSGNGRRGAIVLAVLIPLAAIVFYLQLGNPQGLESRQSAGHQQAQELDAMLAKLAERLKANPDDAKGWVMLARSYKALGRFAEAGDAYARGTALVESDPYLLADYAEVLLKANGGKFTDKTDALIAKALKIDPNAMLALFLAGHSANMRKDFNAAIAYWERLLPQLDANSEDAEAIEATIEEARAAAGMQGGKRAAKKETARETAREAAPAAAGKTAIEGEVVLSGKLAAKAQPDDTLYVFARPAEGSRMPLAVIRARVADLPLKFRLDDSNGLPGGQKLSAAQSVVLEARVTKGGIAQTSPGDLVGTLSDIKPGSRSLRLVIDRVQP